MDRLTPEQRRKCMKANKSKGTKPEILLAKALWHMGLRYRKNDRTIFGNPDLSFKKYKIAVFIDGEFWHGKDWKHRKADIKSNQEFWVSKIERNIKRDEVVNKYLIDNGWIIFRFWGKDVLKDPEACAKTIQRAIYDK
ncbi:very short patch repair endonuclease [Neisseria zalophi]|uniref:Very short patch repair endonuclease n=1 Tax=Neisseria zalophi TaxID=640030 RepID=A0A5J6Q101_9NEIS|nr:very short patch repair endonuclease [Neisseria zalophi]QEY27023.1 DNA mismatch endonuclease Vsr [Neisseria zalophi]